MTVPSIDDKFYKTEFKSGIPLVTFERKWWMLFPGVNPPAFSQKFEPKDILLRILGTMSKSQWDYIAQKTRDYLNALEPSERQPESYVATDPGTWPAVKYAINVASKFDNFSNPPVPPVFHFVFKADLQSLRVRGRILCSEKKSREALVGLAGITAKLYRDRTERSLGMELREYSVESATLGPDGRPDIILRTAESLQSIRNVVYDHHQFDPNNEQETNRNTISFLTSILSDMSAERDEVKHKKSGSGFADMFNY